MPSSPQRIGRYEIKSALGGGGMGSLYLARDPNTGRLVALKLLRAHLDSGELRARFAREAQALAALSHPNIVTIYDSGEFRGSPFIVMEYVRGETVGEKIKRRAPVSLGRKLKLIAELCAGLAHAHEAGIIHRDIKPANLMVDHKREWLKVVDFGIARVTEGLTRVGLQVTQVNMQIGTPGYMAPEQIEGGEIDHRTDLFAVGVVLYELLSYHEAFSGTNTRQIERKVLEAHPAPLASLVADLDPGVAALVDRALQKDPNQRFQDAAEFEAAVEQQRARLGLLETPVPAAGTTPLPLHPGAKAYESRADAAYRRALEVFSDGAFETAKRFAIEALAEEPAHGHARELLTKLEPGRPLPPVTEVAPAVQANRTIVDDGPSRSRAQSAGTILAGQRTVVGIESVDGTEGDEVESWGPSSDATVVIPPSPRRLRPAFSQEQRERHQDRGQHVWSRDVWLRYAWPLGIAAAVLLATAIAAVLVLRPWDNGHALTISKPAGGTLTSDGIACGSGGDACQSTLDDGRVLELAAQPDEGFTFAGFTGDCAPAGRVMMSAPRTCGATFVRSEAGATKATVLLTVAPPTGGSIVGSGIACGSIGAECTATHPQGTVVSLKALADNGFVFRGFTGECAATGEARLDGPRTCGATFAPAGKLATRDSGATGGGPGDRSATRRGGASAGTNASVAGDGASGRSAAPPDGGAGSPGGNSSAAGSAAGTDATPPPITSEQHARGEIQKALTRYRTAYQDLDYAAIQRVFPTAPEAIRGQLRQYKSLEYTFDGEPEFIDLDAGSGVANIEIGFKQVFQPRVGGSQPPNEGRVRFKMFRRDTAWLIDQTTFLKK